MTVVGKYVDGLVALFLVCLTLHCTNAHDAGPHDRQWTVNHGESVCMIMGFNGSLTFPDGFDFESAIIPASAESGGSLCDGDFSIFQLEFDLDNITETALTFIFNKTGAVWMMSTIAIEVTEVAGASRGQIYFMEVALNDEDMTVPFGSYFECEADVEIEDAGFVFTSIEVMQPFATGGVEGKEFVCGHPPTSINTGLIVGCVLAGMVVCVISCFVYNKVQSRRHRQHRYRHSKNYIA